MQRYEATNWTPSTWIAEANQLALDLKVNLKKPESKDSSDLLERCTQIVSEALKSQVAHHSTAQENQMGAKVTGKILKRLTETNATLSGTINTILQEKLNTALAETRELDNLFNSLKASSLPLKTMSTTTTPTIKTHKKSKSTQGKGKGKERIKPKTEINEKQLTSKSSHWNEKSIMELASKDIHVDSVQKKGLTPLAYAVKENDLKLVNYLLFEAHGDIEDDPLVNANPNQKSAMEFLIFHALEQGNEEIALAFIKAGANKVAENRRHESVLMVAIEKGAWKVISSLIKDPKVLAKVKAHPNSYLAAAILSGNDTLLKELLINKVIPNKSSTLVQPFNTAVTSQNMPAIYLLQELLESDPNQIDKDGNYPLLLAGKNENTSIFNYLISSGANFSRLLEKNDLGICPLEQFFNTGNIKYEEIYATLNEKDKKQAVAYQEKLLISTLIQASKLFTHPATLTPRQDKFDKAKQILSWKSVNSMPFTPTESATFWGKELREEILLFAKRYSYNLISEESVQTILEAFDKPGSLQNTLQKIRNGKPVCLHSGYYDKTVTPPQFHSTTVTFCEGFMCICDRSDPKSSVQVIQVDPKKIREDTIREIIFQSKRNKKKYSKAINFLIKELAPGEKRTAENFEENLVKEFPLGAQISKNGALENMEGSLWFLLAMSDSTIKKRLGEMETQTSQEKSLVAEEMHTQIKTINRQLNSLLLFNQMYQLEKYIDPNRDGIKRFAKDKNLIEAAIKNMVGIIDLRTLPASLLLEVLELNERIENPKSRSLEDKK